jgi:hypothetical protein
VSGAVEKVSVEELKTNQDFRVLQTPASNQNSRRPTESKSYGLREFDQGPEAAVHDQYQKCAGGADGTLVRCLLRKAAHQRGAWQP